MRIKHHQSHDLYLELNDWPSVLKIIVAGVHCLLIVMFPEIKISYDWIHSFMMHPFRALVDFYAINSCTMVHTLGTEQLLIYIPFIKKLLQGKIFTPHLINSVQTIIWKIIFAEHANYLKVIVHILMNQTTCATWSCRLAVIKSEGEAYDNSELSSCARNINLKPHFYDDIVCLVNSLMYVENLLLSKYLSSFSLIYIGNSKYLVRITSFTFWLVCNFFSCGTLICQYQN